MARGSGRPFYERLNEILKQQKLDAFVEELCARLYAQTLGRPSLPPAVYFRLLMVGYFEGIDSERGIGWRLSDSLSLRRFVGLNLSDSTTDHSTISRNRRLIDLQTHEEGVAWVAPVERGVGGLVDLRPKASLGCCGTEIMTR